MTEPIVTTAQSSQKTTASLGFDFIKLLEPIPGNNPAGVFLRDEGTYDTIREARREDNSQLPRGVWERSLDRADWQQVVSCMSGASLRSARAFAFSPNSARSTGSISIQSWLLRIRSIAAPPSNPWHGSSQTIYS